MNVDCWEFDLVPGQLKVVLRRVAAFLGGLEIYYILAPFPNYFVTWSYECIQQNECGLLRMLSGDAAAEVGLAQGCGEWVAASCNCPLLLPAATSSTFLAWISWQKGCAWGVSSVGPCLRWKNAVNQFFLKCELLWPSDETPSTAPSAL